MDSTANAVGVYGGRGQVERAKPDIRSRLGSICNRLEVLDNKANNIVGKLSGERDPQGNCSDGKTSPTEVPVMDYLGRVENLLDIVDTRLTRALDSI